MDKTIIRTWKAGVNSTTMIIPREFAKKYGLDKPCHATIEATKDGLLIKKLEL